MTVKLFNPKTIDCGTAFIVHGDYDVEIHSPEIINCGIGLAQYSTKEELEVLLEKSKKHFEEIVALSKKVQGTKPELRKDIIASSAVFAALSVGSNASTVMQFLIDNFPMIGNLLK
ncbi:TPA: hypothetical protein LZ308_002881 [Enterobacter cloacae subsp. cloacae]|uniref:Uncharacterized protein n=1 Tax=Enterobacter cloacae TaxID=550 RepID=A0AAW6S123_ENTCL|nr:hypothetical protein [Enterobacter cloacae]MDH0194660.1 hypothetical protein [Enterobacter cloacae]HBM7656379.1 hypothetical protein [Enterobacter cloacae subsp. cloacae]HDC4761023.1 hypothetical protein [Enterobacter cloacae]